MRGGRFFFEHDLTGAVGVAVEPLIGVAIGLEGGALQRDAREQPAGSRVADDFGPQVEVGRRFGVAAHWPHDGRGISAELKFVLEQLLETLAVHDHQDEVDGLPTDLQTKTCARQCQERRLRPLAVRVPGADHALATMTAEDEYGNTSSCTFDVTVEEILGTETNSFENQIALIPNPSFGNVQLVNNSNEQLKKVVISDVNGRIINTINLQGMNDTISFSLESYATGLYFISIEGETSSVVKRIIKK